MAVQTSAFSFPPDCREVFVEIAAVVLFGSVALWLAGVIATRGLDHGT
jgi:NhaP-type Na+/H+ or K+/H+ antiporter